MANYSAFQVNAVALRSQLDEVHGQDATYYAPNSDSGTAITVIFQALPDGNALIKAQVGYSLEVQGKIDVTVHDGAGLTNRWKIQEILPSFPWKDLLCTKDMRFRESDKSNG